MQNNLYTEYLDWFKKQFDTLPDEKYLGVEIIRELLMLRNDLYLPLSKDIPNLEEQKKKLEIITFEEYKNSKNAK